ncbi:MAG: AgmX/PglI C-terminal domain-containing protein [Polyangiaceae bacterium]|nr:AgmX/PglI C-terminal domain-containing protein [Polyangiaceae bacterium]
MTQSAGPQGGQRPGRMTAVMRAMPVATGPKVLRIGLVQGGKVIEERVIKQRGTVTVGPSEKNTFVVLGAGGVPIPSTFKLFELIGQDYYLNYIEGMGGRVALQTGVADLKGLKGQAKQVQVGNVTAYQVKLTEDARGKVVVNETTFLFQFVAPPPVQPKPQLPSSVKAGIADEIDWAMTIIAAFSFLLHFGAVGSMYSDWADRVLPDEGDVRGLVSMVKNLPPPPPAEKPVEEDPNAKEEKTDKSEKTAAAPKAGGGGKPGGGPAGKGGSGKPVSGAEAAAIGKQLAAMEAAVLGVVGSGPAAANVLADGNVPTGSLDTFAKADSAVGASGPGGLKTGVAGGPVGAGDRPGLGDGIPAGKAGGAPGSGTTTTVAAPKANVSGGGSVSGGKISNASRVIGLARAKARACYQQGLSANPDMEGRASFTLTISGSGSVSSASVSPSGSLSGGVASCIKGALQGLSFDPPEGGTATVSGSFSFVNANKGK